MKTLGRKLFFPNLELVSNSPAKKKSVFHVIDVSGPQFMLKILFYKIVLVMGIHVDMSLGLFWIS